MGHAPPWLPTRTTWQGMGLSGRNLAVVAKPLGKSGVRSLRSPETHKDLFVAVWEFVTFGLLPHFLAIGLFARDRPDPYRARDRGDVASEP